MDHPLAEPSSRSPLYPVVEEKFFQGIIGLSPDFGPAVEYEGRNRRDPQLSGKNLRSRIDGFPECPRFQDFRSLAAGLPGREAAEVLKTRAFREAVDADWELAGQLGISAVPTFVLDGWAEVGAQPYEALEKFLLDHGVKRRA